MIGTLIDYEYVFILFCVLSLLLIAIDAIVLVRFVLRRSRIQLPQIHLPRIHIPHIRLPQIKWPQISLPKINIHLPHINLPHIKLPSIKLFHRQAKVDNGTVNVEPEIIQEVVAIKVQKRSQIIAKLSLLFVNVLLLGVITYLGYNMFWITPGVEVSYPLNEQALEDYGKPIYIIFDRPINETQIKPYIFPEIKGQWKVEAVYDFLPFLKRKVVFYPEESMYEGKVFVYYAGIANALGRSDLWEYGLDSQAIQLPTQANVNTDNNPTDFAVDGNIEFILNKKFGSNVDFEFEITPQVTFQIVKTDNTNVTIDINGTLGQSKEYSFKLYKIPQRYNLKTSEIIERSEKQLLKEGKFVTIKEPLLKSIEPAGAEVLPNAQIKIVFDQTMQEESVKASFSISPELPGKLEKTDDYTYIYTPTQAMTKATKYDLKLAQGIRSVKGGITEKDILHSFTTIGRVKVTGFSPGYNSGNIKRGTNINVTFNQQVDHASAQSKFSISPAVDGAFSWNGNTMIFNPSTELSYQTTYTIAEGSGVKSVYGLDSNENASTKFTTELQYFALNVPIYYQRIRYACNFYATAMALAYKAGHGFDPMSLYNQVAKDSTPISCDANKNVVTWGNPYSGYVGDVYGGAVSGCNRSGYGVYWGPVSNVISNYRSNSVKSGWGVSDMLREVEKGNPVVIWAHNGYSSSGQIFTWTTPGGQTIRAVSGMHSYVVVGFTGSADNPQSIILNDPNRGRWTISVGYFKALWSYFGNTGIVVY
jgi:uncharacterized protein YvpB